MLPSQSCIDECWPVLLYFRSPHDVSQAEVRFAVLERAIIRQALLVGIAEIGKGVPLMVARQASLASEKQKRSR